MRILHLLAALLFIFAGTTANAETGSIYQMPVALTDQNGNASGLDAFEGHPVIVSMFYGNCPHVCPLLISTIQMLEKQLDPAGRAKLRVLLISLDPDNDTVDALEKIGERHHLDLERWKLTRASNQDVRKIAAVLGIRYRGLPDGEFNHSTVLTLLNPAGSIQAKSLQLGGIDPEFLNSIRQAVRNP